MRLKQGRGDWLFGKENLGQMIQEFFINLYASKKSSSSLFYNYGWKEEISTIIGEQSPAAGLQIGDTSSG